MAGRGCGLGTSPHNGVKIHDFAAVQGTGSGGLPLDPSGPGPILLQDHGNPVQFRNLWLVPLAKR